MSCDVGPENYCVEQLHAAEHVDLLEKFRQCSARYLERGICPCGEGNRRIDDGVGVSVRRCAG